LLHSLGWSWTHDLPASVSPVLGLRHAPPCLTRLTFYLVSYGIVWSFYRSVCTIYWKDFKNLWNQFSITYVLLRPLMAGNVMGENITGWIDAGQTLFSYTVLKLRDYILNWKPDAIFLINMVKRTS
jgi:hypothetical protein